MANFNPGLNPTNDPNYSGAAKELNPDDLVKGMANNTRERGLNLFRGVANAVNSAIEGGYETIKSGVKEAVYEGVDPIRDAQGVGAATLGAEANAAEAAGLGKPADKEAVYNSISRLHAAYEQGKVGDTAYYAQLEAMTRSIRSRFPGFRDEVDAMVHHVTGITPANALRASIENDLARNASAKDALDKEFRGFETTHAKYLPPDYWDRKSSGKPYSETETRAYVGRQQQEEHKIESAKAGLALQAEQNKVTSETAEQTARDGVASIGQRSMGQFLPIMDELIQRQKQGKPLSPEEQNFVRGRFNELKLATESEFNRYFDSPLTKGSDKTLGGFVKDKRAGIIADQMKIIEHIGENLFDPKAGVLEMAAQELKARQETGALEIQRKYPVISNLANLSKTLGPAGGEIIKQVMMTDTALNQSLTSATKNVINGMGVALMTPGQPGSSPMAQIDDFVQTPEGKKPAAVKSLVNQWATIASNPGLPKETLETAATNLFGGDSSKILSRFNGASQLEVFRTLTSPQVTENMKRVGGQAWENYSSWAKNAYSVVFKSAGDQVGQAPDSPFYKVSFSDKSNRFILEPTPEGIRFLNQKGKMAAGYSIMDALIRFTGSDIKSAVDRINQGIERIEPILKKEGYNPGQEILNLTNFMSKYDKKHENLWQFFMRGAAQQPQKSYAEETFGGVHPNFTQASGDSSRGLSLEDPTSALAAVKAAYSAGESGDNYNRLVNTKTHPKEIDLVKMPIKDVLAYQQDMLDKGNKSSAAGKYQIVSKTLRSLVREGVVSPDDLYDENTQEKLADALLERRGLKDYLDGKIPLSKFMKNLGDEWEIIKRSPAAYHKTMFELEKLRLASAQ